MKLLNEFVRLEVGVAGQLLVARSLAGSHAGRAKLQEVESIQIRLHQDTSSHSICEYLYSNQNTDIQLQYMYSTYEGNHVLVPVHHQSREILMQQYRNSFQRFPSMASDLGKSIQLVN